MKIQREEFLAAALLLSTMGAAGCGPTAQAQPTATQNSSGGTAPVAEGAAPASEGAAPAREGAAPSSEGGVAPARE